VYIEGKLKTQKYTDQNGIERWSTNIHADQMQMLDSATQRTQAEFPPVTDPNYVPVGSPIDTNVGF